jgi:hypothetical protein
MNDETPLTRELRRLADTIDGVIGRMSVDTITQEVPLDQVAYDRLKNVARQLRTLAEQRKNWLSCHADQDDEAA